MNWDLEKPDPKRATKSAFNIGFSYIVGGMIPLSPYFFVSNGLDGLKISSVITLVCLFVFGYFKSKFTGVNKISGAFTGDDDRCSGRRDVLLPLRD